MYVASILLCQLALAAAMEVVSRPFVSYELLQEDFEAFKAHYGKVYTNKTEEDLRMDVFAMNTFKIDQHNERYKKGHETYTMGLNKFGDLKRHEFLQSHTLSRRNYRNPFTFTPYAVENATDGWSVDWRKRGAVTPVTDQNQCGASYAFATAGVIESNHFIRYNKLLPLAAQEIIHCSADEGNEGCVAGNAEYAFRYMLNAGGIQTEQEFINNNGSCCRNRRIAGIKTCNRISTISAGREIALTNYVYKYGPAATRIDASKLQFYQSGIFFDAKCSNKEEDLNLEVLVVGFSAADGVPYYIVKNSWGAAWGEGGYVRMARGRDNHCGIATQAKGCLNHKASAGRPLAKRKKCAY